MEFTLYDRYGSPSAYCPEGEYIYSFGGAPLGYFFDEYIYSFDGSFLGWFEDGWVTDLSGCKAYFTEDASGGGVVRPVRQVRPVRGVRRVRPVKGVRQVRPVKPVSRLSWSSLSGLSFFE